MDIKKLIQGLHPYERRVLPELEKHPYLEDLASASGLKDVEAMRALQWLENKKAVVIETEPQELIVLGKNGQEYAKKGLPERRFLLAIKEKEIPLGKLADKTGLSKEEVNICLGLLRQKGAITLLKEKELIVKITDNGKRLLNSEFIEEKFLKRKFPARLEELKAEEKQALEQLKKRKDIIQTETKKIKKSKLTDLGRKLVATGVRDENIVDTTTPQILQEGAWKGKTFRRYDVTINVPKIYGGKKQPYKAFLEWVRAKFVSLGFQEMDGPLVETEFWNMDALYMPQFHSARDIHDAYYVKEPKYGKLDEKLVKKVQAAHEHGIHGSTGWRYQFDEQRTHRHVLRTQGTACSARMLASKNLQIPGKYFGITRVFRHDVIDATHLPDFNQTEGIVIEEGLTFRHLVGLLSMFAKEFADAEEIRIVPGYFPFTEPSAELYAKHPQLGWIELGGAGIFRPEVVTPLLGKNISVLAWGLGIDRIGMFKLGLKDIRNLFSHDITFLRNSTVI
ncbi:MAG: phenylalanine--tRNA ligase subunit alpha [Candidatus Woesearchaeota archaeon]